MADVEAMQTECPFGEFDMSSEAEKEHWFGWFEFGKYDDESYSGFAIQWPNLGILIEEAKQLIENNQQQKGTNE